MSIFVLDASAAINLVVYPEKATRLGKALLSAEEVVAPRLFAVETAYALRKHERANLISHAHMLKLHQLTLDLITSWAEDELLYPKALALSSSLNHSAYDCLYLQCCADEAGTLVTYDKRLTALAAEIGVLTLGQ